MSALPRGRCLACGTDVALRRGGLIREHRVYLLQREQDPTTHLGRTGVCPGSGGPAKEEAPVVIETVPETIRAPEEPVEPQEATDGLEDAPEPAEAEPEVLDEPEKVSRLGDPRRAVVDIIGKRLERMLQPVDIAPEWTGVLVITRRDVAEAFMAPLPPASDHAAAVRTPAFVYVDAVCPVCGIAGEIALEVEAKLVATSHGRKLQLAAKAAALPHTCYQQRLRDLAPTPPVRGQTALDLGDETEADAGDVDFGEGAPNEQLGPDDADLRPTGEVNVDELRGAAERDAGGQPSTPLHVVAKDERFCDDCYLPHGHEGDHDPDVLPF